MTNNFNIIRKVRVAVPFDNNALTSATEAVATVNGAYVTSSGNQYSSGQR